MAIKQAVFLCLILFATILGRGKAWAAGAAQLTVGSEYTSGKYGGEDKTEIWYFPLVGKYTLGPWLLKVVVPYLRITGPSTITTIHHHMPPTQETTRRSTASGLGDVIVGMSYALYENPAAGVLFDLIGNIKFGTADPDQGLGTGENDYAILGDLSKQIGKLGIFTGWGWKNMGSTPDLPLQDTWYGATGLSYKISHQTTAGLTYDYRGEIVDGGSKLSEATLFVAQKISPNSKIQFYILQGFSNASADMGGGVALALQFY